MTDAGAVHEYRRIGERVRRLRRRRGLSVEALAGLVGRSKGWLSLVENGHRRLERRSDIANLAEALGVSAVDLLGEPVPVVSPSRDEPDVVGIRDALLDSTLDDPPDAPARPLDHLVAVLDTAWEARRTADFGTMCRVLPELVSEVGVHAAGGYEGVQAEALRMLIEACRFAADALKNLGQVDLAWIAADRAGQAAVRLGEPVALGMAAFVRAHARPAAGRTRALMSVHQAADGLEPHLGDDRLGHEVYGMLHLSAALARQVVGDHTGAQDHVAEAERVARRIGACPPGHRPWGWFGSANVYTWRTMLAVEAGNPGQGLEQRNRVNLTELPSRTRQAALAVDAGRAHAMLGRVTEAVRELRHAESLSRPHVHHNPIIRELVADMLDRSRREAGGRDLRGLAWRMGVL